MGGNCGMFFFLFRVVEIWGSPSGHNTILAINMETAKKCHNSLNFHRREMIFFSKFASAKDLSNETKLVPVSLFV